jgi:glycosyltransferase involved in cell wall biosynthesis
MTKAIEDNLKVAGVPLSKIFRISNGIEVTNESDQTFQQIRFPTVLFVGNLYQQPAKGIDILLKAWCIVGRKHPNAELNIIGDGNLASFIHFTKKLGLEQSVHFLGKLSQLEHYYRKSSIFVLPSRREGMSNALMEAMLHGLPCVATDISGSRELIDHGSNGLLVPPKDIDALATAINYMISNPDEAALMGRLGRRKIIEEFNMDIICTQYVSLYKSLMT